MGRDEMRVMPLRGADRGMAEKLLYGSNVGAIAEQLDGERIAESMRMRVAHLGESTQAPDRASHGLCIMIRIAASIPEKVVGVLRRKMLQGLGGIGMKQDLDGHAGLLGGVQGEVAGCRIERATTKSDDIADPQSGVEEHVNQGARPSSDVGGGAGIIAGEIVAGIDQSRALLSGERQGNQLLDAGQPDVAFLRGVLREHFPADGKVEQDPNVNEFLPPGDWFDIALGAVAGEGLRVDARKSPAAADQFVEVLERLPVANDRRGLQISVGAVLQKGFGGVRQVVAADATIRRKVAAGFEDPDAPLGTVPIGGAKRFSIAHAVEIPIAPDGACTQGEVLPVIGVRAIRCVTTVRRKHGAILAPIWYTDLVHVKSVVATSLFSTIWKADFSCGCT